MVLTAENYYSQEANEEYMSVSQFKDFCGTWNANTYAPIVFLKALWLLHSNNCPEDIDKEPKSLAQPKQYRG